MKAIFLQNLLAVLSTLQETLVTRVHALYGFPLLDLLVITPPLI